MDQRDDKWIPIPLPKAETVHTSKPVTSAVIIDAILKEDSRCGIMLRGHSILGNKSLKELQKDGANIGIEIKNCQPTV